MKDSILKYIGRDYDLSCSEAILYAASEKWSLGLDNSHYKMVAPFSGGFYTEDVCGIVTASLSVLGILFTDGVACQSPVMKDAVREYITTFKEKLCTINCKNLKDKYRDEQFGCRDIIIKGALILEEVVNNHQLK